MVIQPPDHPTVDGPVIFLAGPIQGAANWQTEATKIIASLSQSVSIANPRRDYLDGEFVYNAQVDWETAFLRRAAQRGVVMFWLAKEEEHIHERAYAQTTRFELAEWKVRHESDGTKLVVGIEDGFTNARYIRRRLSQDCPDVQILNSLKETCRTAVQLAEG
jgi:hypothetical protein